jgi:hypothetical protein
MKNDEVSFGKIFLPEKELSKNRKYVMLFTVTLLLFLLGIFEIYIIANYFSYEEISNFKISQHRGPSDRYNSALGGLIIILALPIFLIYKKFNEKQIFNTKIILIISNIIAFSFLVPEIIRGLQFL